MSKRLYLSQVDRKIAGVCGGVAEYFEIDPTVVRVLWVLLVVFTGFIPGVLAYLILWAIMPSPPGQGY